MHQKSPTTILRLPLPDLALVRVQGGTFQMGGADPDAYEDELPVHPVTLDTFYFAQYPVTQRLWKAVLDTEEEASHFQGDTRPKTNVSWEEARAFTAALNALPALQDALEALGLQGRFRLPSEAEWEFAARGGVHSKGFLYAGGNKLREVGWYAENSYGETKPVGLKFPNELGLYDMSGNVLEWCEDDWHGNYNGAPENGSAWIDTPEPGPCRVCRGGSFFNDARYCRAACRGWYSPRVRSSHLGFRPAFSPSQ